MLGFNLDSIVNAFSRLGTSKDRHEHTRTGTYSGPFSEKQLDNMYLGGRLNRRLVDRPAQDATRRGWQVKVQDEEIEESNPFDADMKRLSFRWKARRANKLARQSGGALMFFVLDDAAKPSEPVDEDSLQSVQTIHVLDRFEVQPGDQWRSMIHDEWREPKTWEISEHSVASGEGDDHELETGTEIHSDRVIKWDALEVPEDRKSDYDGFGQPVLENAWEAIRDLETATQAMATATHQFQYRILKLKDLNSLLRGPDGDVNESKLRARLDMIREGLSVLRMIVLDSEESLETRNVDFSSIVQVYAVFQQNLSAVSEIPITLLFGQAPKGFTSEDDTAIRNYYDSIAGTQQEEYRPAIDRTVELLSLSSQGPTGGRMPEDWSVKFAPLEEPSSTEEATTRKTIAEADAANIDRGVYGPDEARERYTGDDFEIGLALPEDADEEALGGFADAAQKIAETGGVGESTPEALEDDAEDVLDFIERRRDEILEERGDDLPTHPAMDPPAEPPGADSSETSGGRSDAVSRWHGPGDSTLPDHVRNLDADRREAYVGAWNATVDMAADVPDDTLEELARRNAEKAADLDDDRGDQIPASGQITGTDLQPFIEPPGRVESLPENLQELYVETYNDFIANNAEDFEDDPDLNEAALQAALNAVIAERVA